MVRLEEFYEDNKTIVIVVFQFQYGAIGRPFDKLNRLLSWNFNSSMVRLEELASAVNANEMRYFNSSMVRLEGGRRSLYVSIVVNFNSSMVRLEEVRNVLLHVLLGYFNSSMVRLED